jgi:phospholipid/cholesterol/gamma-HCH transport system substrate-binding protein
MESEAKYILVGAVVLLLSGMTAFAAFWMGVGNREGIPAIYKIFFKDQSLAGLQVGSLVTMRGIRVGSVQSFRILPSEAAGVEVIIGIERTSPVRTTTRAVIERNLVTGIAGIELKADSSEEVDAPLLPHRSKDIDQHPERIPVIKEGRLPLSVFADSANDILNNLDSTMAEIKQVFSEENRTKVNHILTHTETILANLASGSGEYSRIPGQIERSAIALEDFLRSAETTVRAADHTIRVLGESARITLSSADSSLRTIGERVGTAAERFEQPSNILLGPNPREFGPGENP